MTGSESAELFGGDVPASIRHLIDSARGATRDETGAALWAAVLSAPRSLPAYYLLYKFHAAAGELAHAQQVAIKALAFISVRLGEYRVARALVEKLRALDPADRVGYGVVDALLAQVPER
ncbi:hypothetical protein WI97_03335 [Burkholderia vietnamiensis]|nr:hypothetical protein WI97_03335 [Burkholderia vietnamiensis]